MRVSGCPGCGDTAATQTSRSAGELSVTLQGETFVHPDYSVLRCATCGLLYKDNTLAWEDLSRYYDKTDYRKWETAEFYPTERATLEILRRLPEKSAILDIGCSSGRLLAPLVGTHDCYGMEINAQAAQVAASKGIRILDEPQAKSRTYRAIVLSDVFEHLPHPTEMLSGYFQCLEPGGILLLSTGNGDASAVRFDPANYWYFRSVEHVVMLTRRYAEYFAGQVNGAVTSWQEVCHYDVSAMEWIRENARWFAFTSSRPGSSGWRRALVSSVPGLRRAKNWKFQPYYRVSRDHVVTTLTRRPNP